MMKRIEKNDPVALCQVGGERYKEGDYGTAIEYLTKAAELGNVKAHYYLGVMYREGNGVEKEKHWIIAANHGHDDSIQALKLS